jgi:hypothetical protein
LWANNSSRNTAIGSSALTYATTSDNTAVGFSSLQNNTTGYFNTAVGSLAHIKSQLVFQYRWGPNLCVQTKRASGSLHGYAALANDTSVGAILVLERIR